MTERETTGDWYPIAALTRADTAVRFLLGSGEVTGRLRIARNGGRRFQALRDAGDWLDLPQHAEPDLWRPLKSADWPDPLPEPATLAVAGQMVSQSGKRRWDARSQQAELAARIKAETEAEVEAAHGPAEETAPATGRRPERWWLDAAAVSYSEPGRVSITEAEARLCRALLTDRLHPAHYSPMIGTTSAALGSLVAEHISSADARPARFEPTPRDLDDYLVAMAWFAALNPPDLRVVHRAFALNAEQRLLAWRALEPPLSWRQIAQRTGSNHTSVRTSHHRALVRVKRAANGEQVIPYADLADPMEALRARNRAARR